MSRWWSPTTTKPSHSIRTSWDSPSSRTRYQPAQDKRWVLIAPPGSRHGTTLLLARATTPEQAAVVGNQSGGRVFLFLETDDFWRDHAAMTAAGVEFVRPPSETSYGIVAVFVDLYGTKWDLIQYHASLPESNTPG